MHRISPLAPINRTPTPETYFHNPLWDEKTDFSSYLPCMKEGNLIYTEEMHDFLARNGKAACFSNEVHYGVLEYRDSKVAVAYKPKSDDWRSNIHAEEIAYHCSEEIAKYTHNHIVPPTIVRRMPDGRLASCQFFVETAKDEDMWNSSFREAVFQEASVEIIQEMAVFNAVFNNWDRHPGNYLATRRDGRLYWASIDNEAIAYRGWTPKWGERNYVAHGGPCGSPCHILLNFTAAHSYDDFAKTLKDHHATAEDPCTLWRNVHLPGGNQSLLIKDGRFWLPFHQNLDSAFPLPKGPYSPDLIKAYQQLSEEKLEPFFRPYFDLSRVSDILARRDQFLAACSEP